MAGRTIAIGDIHGCAQALAALLESVAPTQDDTIITLGDYIDRGPDSAGVIEQLLELQTRCRLISLIGNHEVLMLDALQTGATIYWRQAGGDATVESYGSLEKIPAAHIAFLTATQRYAENETHFFVHANYEPQTPLARQPEQVLLWQHLQQTPKRHCSGKIAVVGHTPQTNGRILDAGHLVCIDTCCFGGFWLTAYETATGRVWQANNQGEIR